MRYAHGVCSAAKCESASMIHAFMQERSHDIALPCSLTPEKASTTTVTTYRVVSIYSPEFHGFDIMSTSITGNMTQLSTEYTHTIAGG